MPLIELHPELRDTNRQLKRIADAFEQYLRLACDYSSAEARGAPATERDVAYTNEMDTVKRELLEDLGKVKRRGDVVDDDGADADADEVEPVPAIKDEAGVGASGPLRSVPTNVSLP